MGLYSSQVVPRFIDLVMRRRELEPIRARVAAPLDGEVLEIGFGSGLNVPHYPPGVTDVRAVDPATVGRKLAAKRVARSGVAVHYIDLDAQTLSLASDSIDHVLTTWTLCSIPDVDRALSEIHRVLRPGGMFHFVEHGRSPTRSVADWQDRLTPIQRRLAGGCHLNRPIDQLVLDSGLDIVRLENYYAQGPRPFGYMFEGVATKMPGSLRGMNAPERNASDHPLPGSTSDQNQEEQPGGHDETSGQQGPGTPHERGDEEESGGESGEGSQSTGDPDAAG